ncbi:hypothetical protein ACFSS8_16135 [Paracoccus kondratievae]
MRIPVLLTAGIICLALAGPQALGRLALLGGMPGLAVPLLSDPVEKGVALYRAGQYDRADKAFAASGRSQTYNRGLSLAAIGNYPLSVAYFDAVLFSNPADAEARHNRDLVSAMYPPARGESVVPGRIRGYGGLGPGEEMQQSSGIFRTPKHGARLMRAGSLQVTTGWPPSGMIRESSLSCV